MNKHAVLIACALIGFAAAEANAAELIVNETDQQFSEPAITVKAGDTVVFRNADTVTHDIQIVNSDGKTDDKGMQRPGELVKHSFAAAGDYKVRCGLHPAMKLRVSVQ